MSLNAPLLRSSFDLVVDRQPRLTTRFYEILFGRFPQAKPLFGSRANAQQAEMLQAALVAVMDHLEDESWLAQTLGAMGVKHLDYGVTEEIARDPRRGRRLRLDRRARAGLARRLCRDRGPHDPRCARRRALLSDAQAAWLGSRTPPTCAPAKRAPWRPDLARQERTQAGRCGSPRAHAGELMWLARAACMRSRAHRQRAALNRR
jgi:hypothetical protein